MATDPRFQVEWFNVSYRSVVLGVFAVLVLGAGAASGWFYLQRFSPKEDAQAAIERAGMRLERASKLEGGPQLEELIASAKAALGEARDGFRRSDFDTAKFAAIRSENMSLKAISMVAGDDPARLVRFYRIEGDVRVKRAGEFSWKSADPGMELNVGDQVKTSSSGSAEIIYFDGTETTIRSGSLLEIRDLYEDPVTKVRRVKEKLSWGELKASTQPRNVNGSYHEVSTEKFSARSEDEGEFRVTFDKQKKTSVLDVFGGRVQVAAAGKKETVDEGERVRIRSNGRLSGKEALPMAPRLISPSDQQVFIFEDPTTEKLTLSWDPTPGFGRYRLLIAGGSLFTDPFYDAQRKGRRAVIEGVEPGSYHWKVAAVNDEGIEGPFSKPRRFRVDSERVRDQTDKEPPKLEITEFVPIGQMVIINGQTEPGATLWVDNVKHDVHDDGTFYAVVRLHNEGVNELKLVAQDTAGNSTTLNRSAYVETY